MRQAFVAVAALLMIAGCSPSGAIPLPPATPAPLPGPASLAPVPVPNPPLITGNYPTPCHVNGKLPDPTCTPGTINPAVNSGNMDSTICKPGWTATVRPPGNDSSQVKTVAMAAYGVAENRRDTVELDHLVPLELGGSDDVSNLWPELSDIPGQGNRNTKDSVEGELNKAVCAHQVSLSLAQSWIASDWTTALGKLPK